jgi:hypothetical protein
MWGFRRKVYLTGTDFGYWISRCIQGIFNHQGYFPYFARDSFGGRVGGFPEIIPCQLWK